MKGFVVGVMSLIALQVLITGTGPDTASGLIGGAASFLKKLSDPTVPGLPRRGGSSASSTGPAPTAPPAYIPANQIPHAQ